MKNKILTSLIALSLGASLQANSLVQTSGNPDPFYSDFHKQIEQFFNNDRFAFHNFTKSFEVYPKMDMIESNSSYTLKFELAGMKKENIKVTLSPQNILSVSGLRDDYSKEQKDGVMKQERHFGSFNRSVALPKDVKSDSIKVSYEDGILSINIDKDMKKVNQNKVKILPIN